VGGVTEDMTLRELRGKLCRCGCIKAKGQPFCGQCLNRLPEELRQSFWSDRKAIYLEAYQAAVEYLKK
jgi:hypothetical protein